MGDAVPGEVTAGCWSASVRYLRSFSDTARPFKARGLIFFGTTALCCNLLAPLVLQSVGSESAKRRHFAELYSWCTSCFRLCLYPTRRDVLIHRTKRGSLCVWQILPGVEMIEPELIVTSLCPLFCQFLKSSVNKYLWDPHLPCSGCSGKTVDIQIWSFASVVFFLYLHEWQVETSLIYVMDTGKRNSGIPLLQAQIIIHADCVTRPYQWRPRFFLLCCACAMTHVH